MSAKGIVRWSDALRRDVRDGVRSLARRRGFTAAALLTLMIAIGANTAVFSVVYGVLLRPMPYPEPEQLVFIWNGIEPSRSDVLNQDGFDKLVELSQSFHAISVFLPSLSNSVLDMDGLLEEHRLARVSANFFSSVLRVEPVLGRNFTPEDDRPDAPGVVIISDEFWRLRLGSDPNVVGRTLRFWDSPAVEVIGVLPGGFRSPQRTSTQPSLWTTLLSADRPLSPTARFQPIARLNPGVTAPQAQAELAVLSDTIKEADRAALESQFTVTVSIPSTLQVMGMTEYFGSSDRTILLIFFGAVLCVLLIGVVNLAGLELARLPQAEGDLSVRTALGATRWDLVRLTLVRTLIVGVGGGVLGALLAMAVHRVLIAGLPSGFPRQLDIQMDLNVWLFSFGLSIFSALLIAIIPAIQASRPNVRETLSSAVGAYTGARRERMLQDGLTAVETAAALVLVAAAGLLIHSFWRLTTVDMGFDPSGVTTVQVLPQRAGQPGPRPPYDGPALDLFHDAVEQFRLRPDVEAAAISTSLPMFHISFMSFRPAPATAAEAIEVQGSYSGVSSGYFETMRIPLLAGRIFTGEESRTGAPIAVVNQLAAQALWPGEDPIGKELQFVFTSVVNDAPLTVVGVVNDARDGLRRENRPEVYIPWGRVGSFRFVLARASMPPGDVEAMVKTVDPNVLTQLETMDQRFALHTDTDRFRAVTLGGLAAIALLLAALGLYSILSYAVARRTRELGVRLALGAQPATLFFQVFRRALLPALIGLGAGLLISLAFHRALASHLFGIESTDAMTYAAVILILSVVMMIACAIPARRAARIDPLVALRHE